jgi:putative ABC transport system permease protein
MARELFPNGAAIGRQIFIRFSANAGEPIPSIETVTVIGIAADTDYGDTGNRGGGFPYLPWTQHYQPVVTITARTSGDPSSLIDPIKRIVNRADSDLAVMDAVPASALGGARSLVLSVGAGASGLLGGLSLILAMAGLYGVLSELVLRRTRELGIRIALGADARQLLRMVLLDGVRPVVAGLAIGLGCGVILRLGFRPLFIRMLPAFDALIVAVVPLLFIAASLVATYVPARRASRVDPNVALRHL